MPTCRELSLRQAMCKGGQSREALPSSDAAVMAANAWLLWTSWNHPAAPWVAALFFALACFGRSLAVIKELHFRWVSTGHLVASFVVFLLAVAAMQKRTRIFDERKEAAAVAATSPGDAAA
eukprot:Skav200175  [mRNA]  locus=scaffold1159:239821:241956:- [translate_table: standard]